MKDILDYNPKDHIIVKGAYLHNLRQIDVAIPRNKLTVITGLSGSGKSSWHLIHFMQKDKDVMLKVYHLMLVNLWED